MASTRGNWQFNSTDTTASAAAATAAAPTPTQPPSLRMHAHTAATPPCHALPAVAEVLRAIIAAYRELFKAATLTDGVLLSNYAMAVLVVNEVCKEVGGCCWQLPLITLL